MYMERLTIPDEKIEGGVRRAVIDAREVKKNAMTIYWALKKYEDTGLTPQEIMGLKERDTVKMPIYQVQGDERYGENPYIDEKVTDLCYGMNIAKGIIRKHMNDGWVPVEERLPTKEEFLKDDGRFILDDGNRRYQGLFDIYDGKFKFSRHISGIHYELFEDECVIAWQPLPEPYQPERSRK